MRIEIPSNCKHKAEALDVYRHLSAQEAECTKRADSDPEHLMVDEATLRCKREDSSCKPIGIPASLISIEEVLEDSPPLH